MDKNTKVVIVAHESFSLGPAHELRDYLSKQLNSSLIFITHPLLYFKEDYKKSSKYAIYKNGERVYEKKAFHWVLPMPFLFIKDVFYTLFWSFFLFEKADIFFGVDPLNAFVGILLKKIGKVKKVIYYSIDYSPSRFKNRFLNDVYHWIERFSCYYSDAIWIGTKRTLNMWIKSGFSENKIAKIIVVSDGNHALEIKKKPIQKVAINQLVYLGFLDKKQGIELVLESMPMLYKKNTLFKFIIIGTGDYLDVLQRKCNELNLRNVEFKGYLDDKKTQEILTRSGIGVAPYIQDKNSFTYYSDPGKPKYYLACGLPVIITNVPAIAKVIDQKEAGIMIDYDKSQFVEAVLKIVDKKNYPKFKKNAEILGNQFDWSIIFKKSLEQTFS